VVPDLYLPREARGGSDEAAAFVAVRGFEQAARFGARAPLRGGWRGFLLRFSGCADLEGIAPACIAAAALAPRHAAPLERSVPWIATALHLQAGLGRVHLGYRGLLRLPPPEQAELAAGFLHTFGSCGYALTPLPAGEFLLDTPGLAAIATSEPERCVGGEPDRLVPVAAGAAALRRLLSEIEMWLHAQPLNERRRSSGAPPVTALWPWGSIGRIVRPQSHAGAEVPVAFGRDAWLEGLWRLQGSECLERPERLEAVVASPARAGVLLAEVGGQLRSDRDTVTDAVRELDARFVAPAVQALRGGALEELTVILNDVQLQLRRANLRRFWRRSPSGLTGFA
jgi:hypothetical protein